MTPEDYAIDEEGRQLAFVAERDSAVKALVKFYRLWYYTPGMDSAVIRADRATIAAALSPGAGKVSLHYPAAVTHVTDPNAFIAGTNDNGRNNPGLPITVSPDYANAFSRDGSRLFLGLSPVRPPKDTMLVEFETSRLDVWNYNDDYLAPQQLVSLNNDLKRSWLAVLTKDSPALIPLADDNCETVIPSWDGNSPYALGQSSKGYRIQQQWEENGLQNIWVVDCRDGSRRLVKEKVRGGATLSPGGKFILWYDWHSKNWFAYEVGTGKTQNITAGIKTPLYDEEDDHPDDPPPHGVMGWKEGDRSVCVYDKYDVWQCDPTGQTPPVALTLGIGRRHQYTFRYVDLERRQGAEREDPAIHDDQWTLFTIFDQKDMSSGLAMFRMNKPFTIDTTHACTGPQSYSGFFKAKEANTVGFLQGSFDKSYDI